MFLLGAQCCSSNPPRCIGHELLQWKVQNRVWGLGYFAQVWLHVQTLLWTVTATGDLLCSKEPLHTRVGMGRAGSSGRDVLVSGGGVGPSLSLAGLLTEAIMAQILSLCPTLPLPWAAATLPTPLVVVV